MPGMPPQGMPPGAPSPAPGAGAPAPQGGGAQALVQGIHQGLSQLGQMLKQAGPAVGPEDHQLYETTVKSFEALVDQLTGAPGQAAQAQPAPPPKNSSPMPANAGANSQPAGF